MSGAIAARQAGKTVALIERGTLGGTCVNIGCVPSKTLLAGAGLRQQALSQPFAGITTTAQQADMAALVGQKDELTAALRHAKYADVAQAYGFEVIGGHAAFTDDGSLLVNGQRLPAAACLIATGAQPARPAVAGLDSVDWLTSTTAMELKEVPESLIVVGGGYVGMEQAQLFAGLGSAVTIVGRLAPAVEPELSATMRAVFADEGITVIPEHAIETAASADGHVSVTTQSGRRVSAERLLIATGRTARTAELNLKGAGVDTDTNGFIVTDEHQQTSKPGVYAAGDVVAGAPQFVYVAAAAGRVAALNALGLHGGTVDYTGLPAVIFTKPQLASAGLTEQQALAAGHACECRVLDLSDVPRALVNHDTRGAVKLVADAATGAVLGAHAAADGAGEMMLAATYAIRCAMTVDDIADTWAPYLTMAESLRITAGLFRNQMPTSCCA